MNFRTKSAIKGWCSAVPHVLMLPVLLWLTIGMMQVFAEPYFDLMFFWKVLVANILLSVAVHFVVFLCIGLPMFLVFWPRESALWRLPVAITVGPLLGLLVGSIIGYSRSFGGESFSRELMALSLGYGTLTALGCWIARKRFEKIPLREGIRGLSQLEPQSRDVWEKIAIKPERWRSGQYGGKRWEWVVAVTGNRCLYYNSVEEGWGWGSFSVPGIISGYHWQQDELLHQVHHVVDSGLRREAIDQEMIPADGKSQTSSPEWDT